MNVYTQSLPNLDINRHTVGINRASYKKIRLIKVRVVSFVFRIGFKANRLLMKAQMCLKDKSRQYSWHSLLSQGTLIHHASRSAPVFKIEVGTEQQAASQAKNEVHVEEK